MPRGVCGPERYTRGVTACHSSCFLIPAVLRRPGKRKPTVKRCKGCGGYHRGGTRGNRGKQSSRKPPGPNPPVVNRSIPRRIQRRSPRRFVNATATGKPRTVENPPTSIIQALRRDDSN
ncbi:hypothetical protein SKAU_G00143230 [Synaphobranchus kaupii]|uniref:Uncharacterized protein n=1 Tax=Synaphobranchus kaupii TaxID=118154 RepID=A0A9Q1J2C6_SYNKA|nr:hypothetical protein SKAU_G00143230 [Synaphobranchus kaupii]